MADYTVTDVKVEVLRDRLSLIDIFDNVLVIDETRHGVVDHLSIRLTNFRVSDRLVAHLVNFDRHGDVDYVCESVGLLLSECSDTLSHITIYAHDDTTAGEYHIPVSDALGAKVGEPVLGVNWFFNLKGNDRQRFFDGLRMSMPARLSH